MATKNKDYPTNSGLIATLASKGVTAKANQSADPGKRQQMAADFKAGVRYTPINSGSVRAVPAGTRIPPSPTLDYPALRAQLGQGGSIAPMRGVPSGGQSYPGPARGLVQPQQQFTPSSPMSTYSAPTNYIPSAFSPQPNVPPSSAYNPPMGTGNPWTQGGGGYRPNPVGVLQELWPDQKPAWMPYSTWALALMDRNK